MTRSAKGTVEKPGKQVKQKSGLNRSILASGWSSLERKLAYKAGELRKVNPAYTSLKSLQADKDSPIHSEDACA